MGDRWGPDGPPAEAYSRVTDPERFAPVVEAADALVAELAAAYDVVVEPVTMPDTLRAVLLTPAAGAPMSIGVTDFPSLRVRCGVWHDGGGFPQCGCDACDETAESAIDALRDWAGEVVDGAFTETLSRWPRRLSHTGRTSSGWQALDRAQLASLAALSPPGTRRWDPWPRRPG
jgi:hypothetical protein